MRWHKAGDTWVRLVPHSLPALPYEMGDEYRAGGDCVCKDCGMIYYDHPNDYEYECLQVLCSGQRVKL